MTAATAVAPTGARRRLTRRRKRDAGRTSSRAAEYIARAVSAWAEIPQARNPVRTTAAKGLPDHDPNELTTAVATGSASRPSTTAAGSGCARVAETASRVTTAATLSIASQIALGT